MSSLPLVSVELPHTAPNIPVLDGAVLPRLPARMVAGVDGSAFRRITERNCLLLGAAQAAGANLFDEENGVPLPRGSCYQLRPTLRYYTALELRNRSAADALERYFQLADAEARTDILRKSFTVIDPILAKATEAKEKGVRYPLDPADLERQRSQLLSQLEQAEFGSRLLNLDLKRRLGLSYQPADERLWPAGDFAIDPTPIDPDEAATAALADRPELRGLRALHDGLTLETLPDLRDLLSVGGTSSAMPSLPAVLRLMIHRRRPDPALLAELAVRRKQLADLITARERLVADEARAAALAVNAQRIRATRARDRLIGWDEKLADAVKKRDANLLGAEFLEPQVRMEWLKAKGEVIAEVAAWHQARVRLRAAMGWLVWEAVGSAASPPNSPDSPPSPASPPTTAAAPGRGACGLPAAPAGRGR